MVLHFHFYFYFHFHFQFEPFFLLLLICFCQVSGEGTEGRMFTPIRTSTQTFVSDNALTNAGLSDLQVRRGGRGGVATYR